MSLDTGGEADAIGEGRGGTEMKGRSIMNCEKKQNHLTPLKSVL